MHQHTQSPAQHSKTSAFIPVVKPEPPLSAAPPLQSPQIDAGQGIFQSEEVLPVSRNMGSEQNPSQDYYCMTCHENFNIRISPCNHKKGKGGKYRCNIDDCKREFNIGSGLERHKLVHTGARPYECDFDQCDQKFNQKSNLNRHRRIHTQQKPFICEKCCKSFTTTTNLKQHVQVHLEDKERRRKFVCQIKGCNKEYLYMCNLKKHKQEHEDPMGECIGQRKPDYPTYSIVIGNCTFRILYKRLKDHSQLLVTFRQVENALKYSPEHFSKVLEAMSNSEQKGEMNGCMEEMEAALDKLFESSKSAVNVCFEMHLELSPVANLLIKAAMGMTATMGAKIFTVVVPSSGIFRDVVQNLLNDLQPE